MLQVTLLQAGVHYIKVPGRHMDVYIDINGHHFNILRAPEIELQTPKRKA